MRTGGQFVGVLLLVGFVGAYFWWIVSELPGWLYPSHKARFDCASTAGRTIHCPHVERTSSPTPAAIEATLDPATPRRLRQPSVLASSSGSCQSKDGVCCTNHVAMGA